MNWNLLKHQRHCPQWSQFYINVDQKEQERSSKTFRLDRNLELSKRTRLMSSRDEFDGQMRWKLSCLDTKTKGLFRGVKVGLSELRTLPPVRHDGGTIMHYLQNVQLQQLERQKLDSLSPKGQWSQTSELDSDWINQTNIKLLEQSLQSPDLNLLDISWTVQETNQLKWTPPILQKEEQSDISQRLVVGDKVFDSGAAH